MDLYRDEGLFEKADELGAYWADAAHSLRGKPHVIDIRNIGLIAGIELEPRPGAPTKRATELFHACFDNGLLVRATGDIIALSPAADIGEGAYRRDVREDWRVVGGDWVMSSNSRRDRQLHNSYCEG